MNIFVDENIPKTTVQVLREKGHDVKDIRGTDEEGVDDEKIWKIAISEKRLIITTDKGFSILTTFWHLNSMSQAAKSLKDSSTSHKWI